MMGDALDFLNESDAITFVALGLIVFQRLHFGLQHGAELSPHDGVYGPGVTFQEVDSFHIRLYRRLPNHLVLSHLFVILF
jgi:hypothetical protein